MLTYLSTNYLLLLRTAQGDIAKVVDRYQGDDDVTRYQGIQEVNDQASSHACANTHHSQQTNYMFITGL